MKYKSSDIYLQAILEVYESANKYDKGSILSQAEKVTKRSRKHIIKCLKKLSLGENLNKGKGRPFDTA